MKTVLFKLHRYKLVLGLMGAENITTSKNALFLYLYYIICIKYPLQIKDFTVGNSGTIFKNVDRKTVNRH